MKNKIILPAVLTGLICAVFVQAKPDSGAAQVSASSDTGRASVSSDSEDGNDYPDVMLQESDEDLLALAEDYIRKDIQLKGAFFLENPQDGKILRLGFEGIDKKSVLKNSRRIRAFFKSDAGKRCEVEFVLEGAQWGSLDIYRIELKKIDGAAVKPVKKERVETPKKPDFPEIEGAEEIE
ncbi:MAG: hypothetical protein ABIG11_09255 [bacterium]